MVEAFPSKELFKKIFEKNDNDSDKAYEEIARYCMLRDELAAKAEEIKTANKEWAKTKKRLEAEWDEITARCDHPEWKEHNAYDAEDRYRECEVCCKREGVPTGCYTG